MIMQRQFSYFKQVSFQSKAGILCCWVWMVILSLPYSREASAEALKPPQDLLSRDVKPSSRVEQLALQLGDESFELRDQAMAELWKLGRVALPTLRLAEAGDDIEASERASELIHYISIGLLYDCPEEAKGLVLKFFQHTYEGKVIILHKLMKLDLWKQVLNLGFFDSDPYVKRFTVSLTWPRLQTTLSRSIAGNDHEQVGEIISMLGDSDLHMRVKAHYYVHTDQLDKKLSEAEGLLGKEAARWRMWLYRCSGDLEASIREAENASQDGVADLLRVLDGNAIPWLERSASEGDAIYRWGCKLQQLRLEGKDAEAQAESEKWKELEGADVKLPVVSRYLAVNGFREPSLDALKASDANAAFDFYDLAEMPTQSLRLLGIQDNAKPPYVDWVGERIEQIKKGDADVRKKLSKELMMLSHFLYSRGEVEHAADVITPMMTLSSSENKDWDEHIEAMLLGGMGSMAIDFMKKRLAQGNTDRDELVKMAGQILKGMQPLMRDGFWDYLSKRKGDTNGALLDQVGLLAGLLPDPEDIAAKIHDELLLEIGEEGAFADRNRIMLIDALFHLCIMRNDLGAASKMIDGHADVSNTLRSAQVDIRYNLLRWEQVEPALAARAKNQPDDHKNLIKWHITLQKLGRNSKSQEVIDQAVRLCLGNPGHYIDCGQYLYAAGYELKAIDMWTRAAMMSDLVSTDLDDFVWVVTLLASHGQPYYALGDWQKAWSINEVFARFIMRNSSVGTRVALKARYQAEFCHGMMLLKQGKDGEGIKRLNKSRQMIPGDGVLADDFFPAIRNKIPVKIYNRWFDECYDHIALVCKAYPRSHNVHNTAAWLCSRAVRHLDEAHTHAQVAVTMRPNQGAYLDTMAEVWFAHGDRGKAMGWSEKAIAASISNAAGSPRGLHLVYANFQQLNKQYQHFKNDPLPMMAR